MTLTVILFVILPAAFIGGVYLGARIAFRLLPKLDCGVAINNDDHGFFDGWEHAALQAETPFSVADETDIVQALRIPNERPKPYPPLRAVE